MAVPVKTNKGRKTQLNEDTTKQKKYKTTLTNWKAYILEVRLQQDRASPKWLTNMKPRK